jgi:ATP-dependent exoDNAse (exonuclease V) alpha subunit
MKQVQALRVMLGGESVFLTGAPGAGKTFVLNQFIRRAERSGKRVAVTASTGIAATHIGGTTIHSWSGLGIRDQLTKHDLQWLQANEKLAKRYNNTDVLVIDEVSMLHGKRLDMVNQACKVLRKNDAPFGGLQVILVGDLFQLPPVSRGTELADFAHTSAAWQELRPKICYIREQHRQSGGELLEVLEAMRQGQLEDYHTDLLQNRVGAQPDEGLAVTRLYSHNVDVESINERHLAALDNSAHTYSMQTRGSAAKVEQLTRSLLAPEVLELKIGAEVMFVANNFAGKYVNGSRGRVVAFSGGTPVVELASSSKEIKVEPHTWTLEEDGKKRAEATQLPLRLAWAITIHKSQGMSLDAAVIDLSKSFTPGMGYVALSRVRSLDGLYLAGLNRMAMQLHPDIHALDAQLQAASAELAANTPEELPDEPPEAPKSDIDEELFAKLKSWRLKRASSDQVAPFIIAHNTHLETIATHKPTTKVQLTSLKGFGTRKVETYGDDILRIVAEFAPPPAAPSQAEEAEETNQATSPDRLAIQAEYPRAFQKWQPEEDTQLLQLFRTGTALNEVSATLGRQPTAAWARLVKLLVDQGMPLEQIWQHLLEIK